MPITKVAQNNYDTNYTNTHKQHNQIIIIIIIIIIIMSYAGNKHIIWRSYLSFYLTLKCLLKNKMEYNFFLRSGLL